MDVPITEDPAYPVILRAGGREDLCLVKPALLAAMLRDAVKACATQAFADRVERDNHRLSSELVSKQEALDSVLAEHKRLHSQVVQLTTEVLSLRHEAQLRRSRMVFSELALLLRRWVVMEVSDLPTEHFSRFSKRLLSFRERQKWTDVCSVFVKHAPYLRSPSALRTMLVPFTMPRSADDAPEKYCIDASLSEYAAMLQDIVNSSQDKQVSWETGQALLAIVTSPDVLGSSPFSAWHDQQAAASGSYTTEDNGLDSA
jgi:hypothetical protein